MKRISYYILTNIAQLLLIMQAISPVAPITESLCSGTGYTDIMMDKIKGSKEIGWNRLLAENKMFTYAFWGLNARAPLSGDAIDVKIRFLKSSTDSQVRNGWLSLVFTNTKYFHYLAVWALNHNNEPYGSFIWDRDLTVTGACPGKAPRYYNEPQAYIPCSAAPANAATVPGMFVYANLKITRDTNWNFEKAEVHNKPSKEEISIVWRAPTQDYCHRPEEFKFMYAWSPPEPWESWSKDWTTANPPSEKTMAAHSNKWGPYIQTTSSIRPAYFGHPSRHDFSTQNLVCGDEITDTTANVEWISSVTKNTLGAAWIVDLWQNTPEVAFWEQDRIKWRATCQGSPPDKDSESGFTGRCAPKDLNKPAYLSGSPDRVLTCSDSASSVGINAFKDDYEDYLVYLEERLSGPCECILVVDVITRALLPSFLPTAFVTNVKDDPNKTAAADNREECTKTIVKLSSEQQTMAGICIHNKVGTLVYGVRQWHGVTSLGVTLIITPLSIFVARYNKGEMMLIEGKVPLKGWYISHILLVFPAIWMYASGFATITRQKDVVGLSYSWAAYFHRTLGFFTFSLIPIQFITGFIRPTNLKFRKVFIFIHWTGGITQHILELMLCIFSSNIPASPTTSRSLVSPDFGNLTSSIVACLIIGWFAFSATFHILLMIRIKRQDVLAGVGGRSLFPIIIPLLTNAAREDLDLGHMNKDIWFERGALLIFSLVSCIVFAVSIVSLYQALHDNLYYGFGPMSCTHSSDGLLVSSTGSNNLCS